jgi:hypothetical protein
MERLKFNSKAEFAKAIIEHGKLYDMNGYCFMFDAEKYPSQPFRIILHNNDSHAMCESWDCYEQTYTTELPKPQPQDFEPVWVCEDDCEFGREVGFYDAQNNCLFFVDTGQRNSISHDHYEPLEKPYPQWVIEAQQKLIKMHEGE